MAARPVDSDRTRYGAARAACGQVQHPEKNILARQKNDAPYKKIRPYMKKSRHHTARSWAAIARKRNPSVHPFPTH
jgi:hypothetical protein